MYIIKLNHLIKLYIYLIYYLKQRYICYPYISFKSKIYDILHPGNEDEITQTDEDGAACYLVGNGHNDKIMQAGGEDESLSANKDATNYGDKVENNAFNADEDSTATHCNEDNEDSTHKDETQDAFEDSLAPNDEAALANSPSMDLELVALALKLKDGPNNAMYMPKFYFLHYTFEVTNSVTCLDEIGQGNITLQWRLARKHASNCPSPINRYISPLPLFIHSFSFIFWLRVWKNLSASLKVSLFSLYYLDFSTNFTLGEAKEKEHERADGEGEARLVADEEDGEDGSSRTRMGAVNGGWEWLKRKRGRRAKQREVGSGWWRQ